jgi:hypothetical protein
MAMGGAVTAIILFAFYYAVPLGMVISITVLLTGLVCTCRFLVSDHTRVEVYSGLIVGVLCQLFSYWFAM